VGNEGKIDVGMPAARVGDMHVCPMVTPGVPPIPHVGGPILPPCAVTVLTGKMPQARIGDMCVCVGPPDTIVKGSIGVFVAGMPAARIGDMTVHGGNIVMGCFTVFIGDVGGGSSGGGGGGGGAPGTPGPAGAVGPIAAAKGTSIGELKEGEYTPIPGEAQAASFAAGQAVTLRQAAKEHAPFCERCQQ
jgi:uncharacterized Zn-binding protein involved in type VI secretion